MSGTGRAGQGGRPDDADLGRLLAEGLGHHAGGPVDERRLLTGARRGAVRIRRRRTAALRVATVLVVMLPVGTAVVQLSRPDSASTAGSAAQPASAVASPESAARSGEADTGVASGTSAPEERDTLLSSTSSPSLSPSLGGSASAKGSASPAATSQPAGLRRTASGQVLVPDDALLTADDLPRFVLTRTSDTANRYPAPAPPAQDTCGSPLTGTPEAAGSREVVLEQRTGVDAARWVLAGTVRVQAGDDAAAYLSAARRLGCVEPAAVLAADAALTGRFRDESNRTHWYGVVQVGRTVSEVRLVAPAGSASSRDEIERLLRVAADRVTASGLVRAAAADPALQ